MPPAKPRPVASIAAAATKRKRAGGSTAHIATPPEDDDVPPPALKRRASTRAVRATGAAAVNPDLNKDVLDAPNATRASPDAVVNAEVVPGALKSEPGTRAESPLSDVPDLEEEPAVKAEDIPAKPASKAKAAKPAAPVKAMSKNEDASYDPDEGDDDMEANEVEVTEALARPPPVNSEYLPLPWKGRLGYACLNTYLRNSNPPVFSSRTCRIQSILEHRYPLRDPSEPEHATKNRPDRSKPADIELGRRYVENLCLANVKDIIKMVRWNDKYHIRFFRLSSEMFPFASHPEYGYKLAPFASDALAEAGQVIAELGHRVTTHPGQFTQLGSPRKPVIDNAIRDLEYHDEMLTLLKLPPQQNRDAIMVLHMGGVFDGKAETLARFRANYAKLSPSIKNRLVLENDDVSWSVHDLLPVCEELNIPMVLDFHHHNIIFDPHELREGTRDIMALFPRIRATWDRKNIRQKMHYSEPTPAAITGRQRRKHSPRVATLPPCADDMDLMIEAKDKEQAVFELMRTFKLPGFATINDILPHERADDNKFVLAAVAAIEKKKKLLDKEASKKKKASAKQLAAHDDDDDDEVEPTQQQQEEERAQLQASLTPPDSIPDDDIGMGGPQNRVYWPPGMEEWLRPKKREVKKKDDKPPASTTATTAVKHEPTTTVDDPNESPAKPTPTSAKRGRKPATAATATTQPIQPPPTTAAATSDSESDADATPATRKAKAAMRAKSRKAPPATTTNPPAKPSRARARARTVALTPSTSADEDDVEDENDTAPSRREAPSDFDFNDDDDNNEAEQHPPGEVKRQAHHHPVGWAKAREARGRARQGRARKGKAVVYTEVEEGEDE